MDQSSSMVGWRGYDSGHLEQRSGYMGVNKHTGAQASSAPERDVDYSRIYYSTRELITGPHLPESPHHVVLPSISQLSDMVPMSECSSTSYRPGFPTVTQDRINNDIMIYPAQDTLSEIVSHPRTEIRRQIRPAYQIQRDHFYDKQDDPLTLPSLKLNFLSENPVLSDRVMLVPEQSSTTTWTSQPTPSSTTETYHSEALLQRSHSCSPSNTSADTPTQRPAIMRRITHTHHCDRCPSKFTRASELKRHYKMHLPERRMFHCWIAGCDRNGEKGFYRSDKFRDHQRKAHRCGKMLGNRGLGTGKELA